MTNRLHWIQPQAYERFICKVKWQTTQHNKNTERTILYC